MSPRAHVTPKQRVLKKYPKAFCYSWAGPTYVIYTPWCGGNLTLNVCSRSAQQAWAEAWRGIQAGTAPLEHYQPPPKIKES